MCVQTHLQNKKNMFLASTLPYTFLFILCDIAPAITQREKSLVNDTWIDPLQEKKLITMITCPWIEPQSKI